MESKHRKLEIIKQWKKDKRKGKLIKRRQNNDRCLKSKKEGKVKKYRRGMKESKERRKMKIKKRKKENKR